MAWIETTQSGLLNLTRASQVRIAQTPGSAANPSYQLEIYMDATEFLVLAQGTQAAMTAHYNWVKQLLGSEVHTRSGL